MSQAAKGHMPFPGHRTVAKADEDSALYWAPYKGKPRCRQCLRRVTKPEVARCIRSDCQAGDLVA
jgi:hypothetical protein